MYSFRNSSGNLDIPLFKYYSNYNYVKDCIENKRIYLSKPENFNDIYDSSFVVTIEDFDKIHNSSENLFNFVKYALNREDKDKINYKEHLSEFENCKTLKDTIKVCQTHYKDINYDNFFHNCKQVLGLDKIKQAYNNKVACFSETPLSILMWSYYANNHKGICLMFDFTNDNFIKCNCHKVQYSDIYKTRLGLFDNYFTKSRQWEHEQEWRIVCDTQEDYIPYTGIVSIILGAKNDMVDAFPYFDLANKYKLDLYQIEPAIHSYNLSLKKLMEHGEWC